MYLSVPWKSEPRGNVKESFPTSHHIQLYQDSKCEPYSSQCEP